MLFFEPRPMASIVMTDATPMMMPNIVRKARSLLLAMRPKGYFKKLVPFIDLLFYDIVFLFHPAIK